jgi:hypothetical protein
MKPILSNLHDLTVLKNKNNSNRDVQACMENEWMGSFKSTEVWPSRSNRAIVLAKQIVILYLMGGNRLEKGGGWGYRTS